MQTEIEVTTPFFPSEVEALLRFQPTGLTWASFFPPAHYFEQRKRLFTYQLIPSMGSEDKKESQALKILAKMRAMTEERIGKEKEEKGQRGKYEEELALEEEEKRRKNLDIPSGHNCHFSTS